MTWAWAVVIPAFIAWVAYRITKMRDRKQLVRLLRDNPGPDPSRRLRLSEIVGDRHDIGTWPGVPPLADPENDRLSKPAYRAVVHQMPPAEGDGEYLTPCCGRSPFDLIAGHEPMALRDEQVTCRKAGDES